MNDLSPMLRDVIAELEVLRSGAAQQMASDPSFYLGQKLAYDRVINLLNQQMIAFGFDPSSVGLDRISIE